MKTVLLGVSGVVLVIGRLMNENRPKSHMLVQLSRLKHRVEGFYSHNENN